MLLPFFSSRLERSLPLTQPIAKHLKQTVLLFLKKTNQTLENFRITQFLLLLVLAQAPFFSLSSFADVVIKINGSTTVNPIVSDGSEYFRKKGWKVYVDTQGGSSGGISHLAEGLIQIGMSSKEINAYDKKKFPKTNFKSHIIGYDGVALVVSKNVYDSGINSLNKDQIKNIYEGKIKNWSQLGGLKKPIIFYNKEPGRGTWEVFANFIYGESRLAPKVFHSEVGANQEARFKVASHSNAMTQLSASWLQTQDKIKAIAIVNAAGVPIPPNLENIKNGTYPMKRPLLLITKGKVEKHTKEFIDFFLSTKGQELVLKHGYLGI